MSFVSVQNYNKLPFQIRNNYLKIDIWTNFENLFRKKHILNSSKFTSFIVGIYS